MAKKNMNSLHKRIRAKNRNDIKEVYKTMEIKRDEVQKSRYDQVQDIYSAFYAGLDPRRRTEMADGGMVAEDANGFSNLSQQEVIRQYPRAGYYSNPYIDDSIRE